MAVVAVITITSGTQPDPPVTYSSATSTGAITSRSWRLNDANTGYLLGSGVTLTLDRVTAQSHMTDPLVGNLFLKVSDGVTNHITSILVQPTNVVVDSGAGAAISNCSISASKLNGNYVVGWVDANLNVFARMYDENDQPLINVAQPAGLAFIVGTNVTPIVYLGTVSLKVCMDDNGDFAVIWHGISPTVYEGWVGKGATTHACLMCRFYNADGSIKRDTSVVNQTPAYETFYPIQYSFDASMNHLGRLVICWVSLDYRIVGTRNPSTLYQGWFRIYNEHGESVSECMNYTGRYGVNSTSVAEYSKISMGMTGDFAIVHEVNNVGMYGYRFNRNGVLTVSRTLFSGSTTVIGTMPLTLSMDYSGFVSVAGEFAFMRFGTNFTTVPVSARRPALFNITYDKLQVVSATDGKMVVYWGQQSVLTYYLYCCVYNSDGSVLNATFPIKFFGAHSETDLAIIQAVESRNSNFLFVSKSSGNGLTVSRLFINTTIIAPTTIVRPTAVITYNGAVPDPTIRLSSVSSIANGGATIVSREWSLNDPRTGRIALGTGVDLTASWISLLGNNNYWQSNFATVYLKITDSNGNDDIRSVEVNLKHDGIVHSAPVGDFSEQNPQVSTNAAGDYVVSWVSAQLVRDPASATPYDNVIRVRKFQADGTPYFDDIIMVNTLRYSALPVFPFVHYCGISDDGRFTVIYNSLGGTVNSTEWTYINYDTNGVFVIENVIIGLGTFLGGVFTLFDMSVSRNGNVMLAFMADVLGVQHGYLYGYDINLGGENVGLTQVPVHQIDGNGWVHLCRVAATVNNNFVFAWVEETFPAHTCFIYAREYTRFGAVSIVSQLVKQTLYAGILSEWVNFDICSSKGSNTNIAVFFDQLDPSPSISGDRHYMVMCQMLGNNLLLLNTAQSVLTDDIYGQQAGYVVGNVIRFNAAMNDRAILCGLHYNSSNNFGCQWINVILSNTLIGGVLVPFIDPLTSRSLSGGFAIPSDSILNLGRSTEPNFSSLDMSSVGVVNVWSFPNVLNSPVQNNIYWKGFQVDGSVLPPVAMANGPYTVNYTITQDSTVTFSGLGSFTPNAGGTLTRYRWYINTATIDNLLFDSTGSTATFTYSELRAITGVGVRNLYLVVTDNLGVDSNIYDASARTTVTIRPPASSFRFVQTDPDGLLRSDTANATMGITDFGHYAVSGWYRPFAVGNNPILFTMGNATTSRVDVIGLHSVGVDQDRLYFSTTNAAGTTSTMNSTNANFGLADGPLAISPGWHHFYVETCNRSQGQNDPTAIGRWVTVIPDGRWDARGGWGATPGYPDPVITPSNPFPNDTGHNYNYSTIGINIINLNQIQAANGWFSNVAVWRFDNQFNAANQFFVPPPWSGINSTQGLRVNYENRPGGLALGECPLNVTAFSRLVAFWPLIENYNDVVNNFNLFCNG